jgi:hypothetical protein
MFFVIVPVYRVLESIVQGETETERERERARERESFYVRSASSVSCSVPLFLAPYGLFSLKWESLKNPS